MANPTSKEVDEIHKEASPNISPTHEGPVSVLEEGSLDPVYEAKAKVLNKAIQDIGMGRYQWQVSIANAPSFRYGLNHITSHAQKIQSLP